MNAGLGAPSIGMAILDVRFAFGIAGDCGSGGRKVTFYRIVGYEEEGCAWGGPDDRGADTAVDASEAAAGGEACGRLKAGF
jgi:hypothetical protein